MFINILLFLFAAVAVFGFAGAALIHAIVDAIRYRSWKPLSTSFFLGAQQLDIYANVTYPALLNAYFIKHGGYHFGNNGETISSALGKNWTLGKLTWLGQGCVGLLNLIDTDHCYKYIEGFWNLPKPGRVTWWKTLVFSIILVVLFTAILKFIIWLVL